MNGFFTSMPRGQAETSFGEPWPQIPSGGDWFSEAFPPVDPFPLGDVNMSMDFSVPPMGLELDSIETLTHDSMQLDDPVASDVKSGGVHELAERYHDPPAVQTKTEATLSTSMLRGPASRFRDDDSSSSTSGRARKRPRIELEIPDPAHIHNVKHHVEELTALDSEQFDEFVARLSAHRKISAAEQAELKKMKRRIHNRESARRSRQDKRDHTDHLEEQIRHLNRQLAEMRLEVATLQASNSQLKNEIEFSSQLIRSSPVLSQLFAELREKHEAARRH